MVVIKVAKKKYVIGEYIRMVAVSSKPGYLNVVELDPNGKVTVLFPNEFKHDNFIKAGKKIRIPEDIGGFTFGAGAPAGKSTILAIVSKEKLNLYEEGVGQILNRFKSFGTSNLASLKSVLSKRIGIVSVVKEYGASIAKYETSK